MLEVLYHYANKVLWGSDFTRSRGGKNVEFLFVCLFLCPSRFLWSPYVIGQTIIFSSCGFFLSSSSLWSPYVIGRPYIFSSCDFYLSFFLWSPYVIGQTIIFSSCSFFLLSSSCFFPRLISAVGDWMFTILLHMAWP